MGGGQNIPSGPLPKKGEPTVNVPKPLCKPEKQDKNGALPGTTSKPSSKGWEKHK